jgi:hypothetical protein
LKSLNTFALIFMSKSINASVGPKAWHWILFIVVVGVLVALILPAIFKWQRQRARKAIHLELANEGNVRSRYALHATEPTGDLKFHFRINGKPLPEQVITVSKASPIPRPSAGRTSPTPAPAAAKKAPNVQKTLSGASQTGGVVAGLLSTLGRLLPGSAGQSLTGIGREVRQGQQTVTQAKQVSQYAGKLQPKPGGSSQPAAISRQPEVGGRGAGSAAIEIWVQTPFVEPGQKMHVDLLIQPAHPYQTRNYPYVLKSRSLEYKEAPVITEEETALLEALNPFERFAPFLIFVAGISVLLILFLSLW